ncbi:MAG TPA: ABC transporter substrate-binding protein [Candidatus Limnocylindria bacterium]|nr:ABC transporter substrate-binding protein [Candidatus Limnocylindria bacterium]
MFWKNRSYSGGLGALVLSVLFVQSSARADDIKIGLPSVTITAMPFFVAKEHGFFKQEGINAEMVVMPAALNIRVLLAGDIQYAATIGSAVAAAIRGINVRTVMLFVDRPLQDLVGGPGINSIAALKGKVVALSSRGGLQDIIMRRMLAKSKIDPAQITMVTIAGQSALIAAVKTGRVAAALLNPPYNFLAYREGLNNLGFSGDFVRLPSTGIATLGENLERNPDQVRRLTRAIARARAFGRANKAKVTPTLKRALRIDDEELLSKIYDQHRLVETADGRVDAGLIADTIRDARQTDGITKEVPANQVFDFSYLPK